MDAYYLLLMIQETTTIFIIIPEDPKINYMLANHVEDRYERDRNRDPGKAVMIKIFVVEKPKNCIKYWFPNILTQYWFPFYLFIYL